MRLSLVVGICALAALGTAAIAETSAPQGRHSDLARCVALFEAEPVRRSDADAFYGAMMLELTEGGQVSGDAVRERGEQLVRRWRIDANFLARRGGELLNEARTDCLTRFPEAARAARAPSG